MLKKRAAARGSPSEATAASRSDDLSSDFVGFSADDLYWLANEQHRLSLRKNAFYSMLSRHKARMGGRVADASRALAEPHPSAHAAGDLAGAGPRPAALPPLPGERDLTSDRTFYLGYKQRYVRTGVPNVSADLLGRHVCEVLGAQACHACTVESARLRQSQSHGSGSLSAVTIAKATRLKKQFRELSMRQLQEKIERGDIASDSFLTVRAEIASRRQDTTAEPPGPVVAPAAALSHSRAGDRRTTFFANLDDLKEKIRLGIIPSAVVPSEEPMVLFLRRSKPLASIASASESFQKLYYSPPLLTVEQQNVVSSFFAGCNAEYSLPPALPDDPANPPARAEEAAPVPGK